MDDKKKKQTHKLACHVNRSMKVDTTRAENGIQLLLQGGGKFS